MVTAIKTVKACKRKKETNWKPQKDWTCEHEEIIFFSMIWKKMHEDCKIMLHTRASADVFTWCTVSYTHLDVYKRQLVQLL